MKQYATCSLQNWPTASPQEEAPVTAAGAVSVWAGIRLSCSKHSSKCGQDSLAVSTPTRITSSVTEYSNMILARNHVKVFKHLKKRIISFHTPICPCPKPLRPLQEQLWTVGSALGHKALGMTGTRRAAACTVTVSGVGIRRGGPSAVLEGISQQGRQEA